MSDTLACGFCGEQVYKHDLYSHAMSNHQNGVEMLGAEAAEMARKVWLNNQTSLCGLKAGGAVCGRPAVVVAGAKIHTLDRATRLSNPTRGKDVVWCSHQKLCVDHALDLTVDEVVRMTSGWEQLEDVAGRYQTPEHPGGLMLDRLFKDPKTGRVGPEPIFWPVVEPVLS